MGSRVLIGWLVVLSALASNACASGLPRELPVAHPASARAAEAPHAPVGTMGDESEAATPAPAGDGTRGHDHGERDHGEHDHGGAR